MSTGPGLYLLGENPLVRFSRDEAQGSLRVLGFNSPMVPVAERFFEVQIPVQDKGAAQ